MSKKVEGTMSAEEINEMSSLIIDQTAKDQSTLPNVALVGMAVKLAGIFTNTDATRRESVMQMADEMSVKGEDDLDEFFNAFKKELGTSSAKVTASKIRGIWKAYAIPSFEYTVGLAEDKKTPVKDTHSGKEWLTTYLPKDKRGFEAFAGFAVEIKGKEASGGGGTRSRTKLNDKDMQSLEDRIAIANKDQAEEIVSRGLDAVIAHSGQKALPVIIDQISSLVKRLETQQVDVSFNRLGSELRGILNDWENQRESIKTSQILANAGMKQAEGPAAPMPLQKAA